MLERIAGLEARGYHVESVTATRVELTRRATSGLGFFASLFVPLTIFHRITNSIFRFRYGVALEEHDGNIDLETY